MVSQNCQPELPAQLPALLIADGNHTEDTMTRAMHIELTSAQGFAARGVSSCVRRRTVGFPRNFQNSLPKFFGADAAT